jgi:hypothetical protein
MVIQRDSAPIYTLTSFNWCSTLFWNSEQHKQKSVLWLDCTCLITILFLQLSQMKIYRASNIVKLTSFEELTSIWFHELSCSSGFVPMKKPGCLGWGNGFSLYNIWTTVEMFGLSSGRCWTHNKATWMHLNTSDELLEKAKHSSISSNGVPFIQSIHA